MTGNNGFDFYGGDLELATTIMKTVANRIQYLLQTQSQSFHQKEAYIQGVFQNVLRTASNILSLGRRAAWLDLHPSQRMKIANSLMLSLEENAFLLAEVLYREEIIDETSSEIGEFANLSSAFSDLRGMND